MIKIQTIVKEIIQNDTAARQCLLDGTLNLSQYSRKILPEVERRTKKLAKETSIIMSLSRIGKKLPDITPTVRDIMVDGTTIKSPLSQVVYEKTTKNLLEFGQALSEHTPSTDELLLSTQNTKSLILLCSNKTQDYFQARILTKPVLQTDNLAAIGLNISSRYQQESNVVYSILHKLAHLHIPLVEIISSPSEVILVVEQNSVPTILEKVMS